MSLFHQTLYLSSKTKPVARVADDGIFVLQLLAYNPIRAGVRDAWRVLWAGADAQAWWRQHGDSLEPGAELLVAVDMVRPFDARGRASGAEIHAAASSLQVTHTPSQRRAYPQVPCGIHV